MMKKLFLFLTFASVFSISQSQDLDKILDNYFETIGQEVLLKAKSMTVTGKILQQGMELPFTMQMKRPGKMRLEADVQGTQIIQAFDGENGWAIMPFMGSPDPVDVTGPELEQMKENADMDGKLWDFKKKGSTAELIGKEDLDGSEAFVIKLTSKNGNIDTYYMDSENFVILKTVTKTVMQGSEVEVETLTSNFQDVNGYIMPFTTEQRVGGQVFMNMNMEKVEFNLPLEETLFVKPSTEDSE